MPAKPITIVGGGLAGLTLGIGLRQRDIPATILEAGPIPRHRVCGEFILGRGQETLVRLGLRKLLEGAGAVCANSAAFFSEARSTPPRPLPFAAICLSRFDSDHALAREFRRLGGELRESTRWREEFGEGVVCATGRRLKTVPNESRWFGLKIHVRNVHLSADLEMHLSPRGYVGLCRVNGGNVNVCGLFRRRAREESTSRNWRDCLFGQPGSLLHHRLAAAELDEDSFCAVAGLSLQPQKAALHSECRIGDAITMIPPVTGNGMSMALESAELALEPLTSWSRGDVPWAHARQTIARRCDQAFAPRLAWAKWLQRALLTSALHRPLLTLISSSDWIWRMAVNRTR